MYYFFYKKFNARRGFSLIEIMVVVGIIGVLTGVVFGSLSDARASSRDRARQVDLKNLNLAIALYKEVYEKYPDAGCSATEWAGPGPATDSGFTQCDGDSWIAGLTPDFIDELPEDPRGETDSDMGYYYRTNSTSREYKIIIKDSVEIHPISSATDDFARIASSCTEALRANDYSVYFDSNSGDGAGSECW